MAQRKKNVSTVLIVCVSLLVGSLVGYIAGFKYGMRFERGSAMPAMQQQFQTSSSRAALGLNAIEIVKDLNCVCGCKMELLPCTCDEIKGSKEIKQFVQALIDEGLSKKDAIGRLVEKYGQDILIKKSG